LLLLYRALSITIRRLFSGQLSYQIVVLEITLQNCVANGCKDELDILCVCGAGKVRVYGLVWLPVELEECVENENLD
jgi:hypothetical protein